LNVPVDRTNLDPALTLPSAFGPQPAPKVEPLDHKERILLVDDEEAVRETLRMILEREGYDVRAAESGEAALRELERTPFDLILTDLKMDHVGGFEILNEAEKLWPRPGTIVLTGFASVESAVAALHRGALAYLVKPCDIDELKLTIRRALERKRLSETESLYEIARSLISIHQIDRILYGILKEASRVTGFSRSLLMLYEGDGVRVMTKPEGFAPHFVETLTGCLSHPLVMKEHFAKGEPLILEDGEAALSGLADLPEKLGCRFLIAVPLLFRRKWVGVLYLDNTDIARRPTRGEIRFIQGLSDLASVAIENARLFEGLTQAKQALESANIELKRRDEVKTEFFSNVSHELKTPMVAVKGYISMVLQGKAGEPTATQREFLQIALNNVNRQLGMIDELLSAVRLEGWRKRLNLETVDLRQLLSESLQTIRPRADEREILVDFKPGGRPLFVVADRAKLVQAVVNLLSNAVKFTPLRGRVMMRVTRAEGFATVSISDTGVGIPKQALKRIFDRFYQASSSRSGGGRPPAEGVGLGLAITQEILREHGSAIRVRSRVGKGSTFMFKLSLAAQGS
jgi:signal transduction histidine kinase/CheY-like chemotaxis protein